MCLILRDQVVVNFGCNVLYILGRWIQYMFLGRLRELESHKSGDRIRSVADVNGT
jgi:membrane protein DedA with SNARE-associated domain